MSELSLWLLEAVRYTHLGREAAILLLLLATLAVVTVLPPERLPRPLVVLLPVPLSVLAAAVNAILAGQPVSWPLIQQAIHVGLQAIIQASIPSWLSGQTASPVYASPPSQPSPPRYILPPSAPP